MKGVYGGLDLAAHAEYLGQALLGAAAYIIQIGASGKGAAHNLEVAHLADMGLDGGLEHEEAQRAVAAWGHWLACCVEWCRHVVDKWHNVAQKLHHAAHTHILEGADAEHRIDRAVDESLADTHAHFVFGEMPLFKEFVHEGLVVFGGSLDELLVELLGAFHLFGGYLLDCGHTAVGSP